MRHDDDDNVDGSGCVQNNSSLPVGGNNALDLDV